LKDTKGKKFYLLNGVKSQILNGPLSEYGILKADFIKIIIKAKSSQPIVILASHKRPYIHSLLLAWPKSDLINALNSGRNVDQTLANQMMIVVTNGKCRKYPDCYKPIELYKVFIKEKFLVFGVSHNSRFDFFDIENFIMKNTWHFIVGEDFWENKINDNIKLLLELYGISAIPIQTNTFSFDEENICRDF